MQILSIPLFFGEKIATEGESLKSNLHFGEQRNSLRYTRIIRCDIMQMCRA